MKYFIVISVLSGLFDDINSYMYRNLTCGVEKSHATMVYEGVADIKTYPWMGTLVYPMGTRKVTTTVVLVTRQIALASANDIDILPKDDIRARARVVIGQDCEKPGIKIRDYTFHSDFRRNTYNALAMVQLDVDIVLQELIPICGPPSYFLNPKFFSMTASNDCKKGEIQIRKMIYVDKELCKDFYNQTRLIRKIVTISCPQLDDKMFWPSHATCARALSGGKCMWRSGTALVVKQDGHWRLLGFGLYGPGCQSPARFLDYGMYEQWVRKSVARIGQPAITRMSKNYMLLRRPLSSVQRFGPCDAEETKYEMYTDKISLKTSKMEGYASYNVTLIHGVEYSCVILKVLPEKTESEEYGISCDEREMPKLTLRRWCAGPPMVCYGFQYHEINFYAEITFQFRASLYFMAYGKESKVLSPIKAMIYANSYHEHPPIRSYLDIILELQARNRDTRWLYLHFFLYRFLNNRLDNTVKLYKAIKDPAYQTRYRVLYRYLLRYQKWLNGVIRHDNLTV